MHTTVVWWQVEADALHQVFAQPWRALDGFLGAAYAMHHVAALLTMSELRDLGRAVGNSDATWFATVGMEGRGQPHVFLSTNSPGGIAPPTPLYDRRRGVVRQAYALVTACACLYGCPACVGPILAAGESDGPTPKEAARLVLALLSTLSHRERAGG